MAPELAAPSNGKAAPKPKAPEPEVEQYCRFEESLATRDYPFEGGPSGFTSPGHYYADCVKAKGGTSLIHWKFHVGPKEDLQINSCSPLHMRSNVDAKPCIDKYGVAAYVTKVACYITGTKPEDRSKQYDSLLAAKTAAKKPAASAYAVLFDIIKRDYPRPEVAAINAKQQSCSSSHSPEDQTACSFPPSAY